MLKRASRFSRPCGASPAAVCALLLCGCCTAFLFSACSSDDDYEIYSTLHGRVTDYATGTPIDNAIVTLSPTSRTQQTGTDGTFTFTNLDAQTYTITVQKAGYQPNRKTVTAISGESVEANIPMSLIER